MIGHDFVDGRIFRLRQSPRKTFDDFIQSVGFVQFERSVETGSHFLFGYFPPVAIESHLFGQKGSDEAEGGSRHRVGHARIDVDVVAGEVSAEFRLESVLLHDGLAQNDGQEFRVGDVLHLGADDPTSFLEERLVWPVRINESQFLGEAVVLADEDDVDGRQFRVLVDSDVACFETPTAP